MNIADPHSLQARIQRSFPAFLGMAAGGERHIPKIEMGVEAKQDIGNLRIKGIPEFYNTMKLFPAVDALSHFRRRRSSV
jgi:hypothetical protein